VNAFIKLPAIAAGTIAAGAVLGVAALAAINWQDEALSPGAAAHLAPAPVRADPDANGIFATIGLGADDPVAYGRRWVEAATVGDATERQARLAELGQPKLELPEAAQCPELDGRGCLGRHLADPAAAREIAAAGRSLAAQYRRLRAYAVFEEIPASLDAVIASPAYGRLLRAQAVVFAEVALAATSGDTDRAVAELAAEIAVHRRLLAGSRTLVTKMIMRRAVQRDLQALVELAAFRPAALGARARAPLGAVLVPLTEAERTMEAAFWHEFRVAASLYQGVGQRALSGMELTDVPTVEWWWQLRRFAYLPNATVNRDFELREPIGAALRAAPAQLAGELAAAAASSEERAAALAASLAPHNLVGNRLAPRVFFEGTEYALAVQDLDGLLRLVRSALLVARASGSPDKIPAALAGAGALAADPYTGKPLEWDADTKSVWFNPQSQRGAREQVGPTPGRWTVAVPAAR